MKTNERSSLWLNEKRRVVTSQHGEDGILEAIFEKIGAQNKWCCEFGAWDGKHLSNVNNLIQQGWSAVLIEGDPERYCDLVNFAKLHENVYPICSYVSDEGESCLDALLARTPIPKNFDLLSIDVDNDDYLIWKAFLDFKPRVVVIEINSMLNSSIDKIPVKGDWRSPYRCGASFKSMVSLAKSKSYELAIHTGNCIFVRREYVDALSIDVAAPDALFDGSWLGGQDETLTQKSLRYCRHLFLSMPGGLAIRRMWRKIKRVLGK